MANHEHALTTPAPHQRPATWWSEPALLLVVALVTLIQGARLIDQPVRGEESRWALGAVEMMRTQDWIVPRQQGTVFPERPPLNSWLMALGAALTGSMSPVAIRLPSLVATVLTSVLLYHYLRRWRSDVESAAVALIYATFGQVLQLGHLGESEAVLTVLIAGSLLLWHDAWLDQRHLKAWVLGCSLAALAALTKGLQGPVYFLAVTAVYLVLEQRARAVRTLLDPRLWLGLGLMMAMIGAWAIPFILATDLAAFRDIWAGLIVDRVGWSGWFEHLVSYPLEILGCWLPWSLFLIPLAQSQVRQGLSSMSVPLRFALVALVITFPSVWLVTGARGRYFMPLAPMAAIVLGAIVITLWSCRTQPAMAQAWWRFVRVIGLIGMGISVAIALDLNRDLLGWVSRAWIPTPMIVALTTGLAGLCLFLLPFLSNRDGQTRLLPRSTVSLDQIWQASFLGSILLLGWIQVSTFINLERTDRQLTAQRMEQLKGILPLDTPLVSFGPVHHRFGYLWGQRIAMHDWPDSPSSLPTELDWFVIDYQPTDSAEKRISGRGRSWSSTSGTLPFAWEIVSSIPMDFESKGSRNWVIVGRVLRDQQGSMIHSAQGIPAADQVMR